jgi:hypothetical protein
MAARSSSPASVRVRARRAFATRRRIRGGPARRVAGSFRIDRSLPDAPLALHDGCVIADDTGGRIKGSKLDFFVGEEANYRVLDRVLHDLERVTVHDGGARCP